MKLNKFIVPAFACVLFIAFQNDVNADEQPRTPTTEGNPLVLPDEDQNAEEKCLTVCRRWGQDCTLNPRTGARKCRRVCKQFGEECFTDL